MPLSDALERDDQYKDDPTKSSYMYFFGFKRNKFCVDMTEDTGRYARLVNHSKKDPNCATKVRLGKQSPPDPVCEKGH